MSNTGEEGEEEDECFYESLDRILSSSSTTCSSSSNCSSAAVSEDDDDDDEAIPRFPKSVLSNNYDIWITQPSSIEERRKRLLQDMGLSHDFSLSRKDSDFGRSVSSDQLWIKTHQQQRGHIAETKSNSLIPRSKSDTAAAAVAAGGGGGGDCNSCSTDHCNCSTTSTSSTSSIHSIPNLIQSTAESDPLVNNHQSNLLSKPRRSNGSIGSPTANVASLNKPPTGKLSRRVDEIKNNAIDLCSEPSSNSLTNGGEFDNNSNCNEVVVIDPDQSCTIKDLDNGKEFVVNELREDGMWNKVREVGTDRQLTLEEFEMFVGHSPIVQELMRRQNVEDLDNKKDDPELNRNGSGNGGLKSKKKGGWLKSIKNVASTVTGHRERRSSDDKDTSSERGGRRSSSATDDSQDVSFHGPERVKVRQYGKPCKELTALYKSQEIQAHNGSIWSIKFSLDGRYLATAGEDCVIHVWQVIESEKKGDMLMEKLEDGIANLYFLANGSPEPTLVLSKVDNHSEKKRRARTSITRKSISLDHIMLPESVFALSEKPICSFRGHLADVLDLSWSKSQIPKSFVDHGPQCHLSTETYQLSKIKAAYHCILQCTARCHRSYYLLSSSMDKTVRLWHMDSSSCLKTFSHSDYVTCIQFNPVDDEYFISGSLDAKVRIWSIRDRQVVDWIDIHEMVTAACFTPDGQGALVGSYKGNCHLYNTSENKLHPKNQIDLQNKKKKARHKKITGFQFAPGSSSEVLITSADSRIRVIDGEDLVHKFKGFRNTSSQISGSLTANGKYVVCASEDSYVYVWKHEGESRPSRSKGVTVTQSFEHFHCQDVSVAIPWPGLVDNGEQNGPENTDNKVSFDNHTSPFVVEEANGHEGSPAVYGSTNSPLHGTIASVSNNYFFDKFSATWPEEKLLVASRKRSPSVGVEFSSAITEKRSAWGMVIVTAGLRGEIKTFQNFGLPVRI